jgi:hypothetical protein
MNRILGTLVKLWARLVIIAALLGAAGGVAMVSASGAQAASSACDVTEYYSVNPGVSISAVHFTVCTDGQVYNFTVTIYRMESGSWTPVASGTDSAEYKCDGSAEHEYMAVGDIFDAACG